MGLIEPRGFRDQQRWVWLFHISSLPQTSALQQKHQSQALSAHISSFDLEQMQKISFFLVVIHNTACTHETLALYQGRLHTEDKEKVKIENVFHLASLCCQQIFWIHINGCAREANFVISDWTKCQPGPQMVLMKVLLLQQMTGHILHLLW